MIAIKPVDSLRDVAARAEKVFAAAGPKIRSLAKRLKPADGSPVFTIKGAYTARGWTEWTQGFVYGCALYQFEGTGDAWFLDYAKDRTVTLMAPHLTHIGVHDHGFNNVSTYGNLLRLAQQGGFSADAWEQRYYANALMVSGAVQAARWTDLPDGLGFIHSFNGPHSLFADTIRSLRALAVSHSLGHVLMGERDRKISLLRRILQHAETTARFNVFYGKGRDTWDVRGRCAHESIFNLNDGSFRCPSSQQGYSAFTTWTRGLSWILLGFAEQLEYLNGLPEGEFAQLNLPYFPNKKAVLDRFTEVASAVADFFIENTPTDGVPYWDTGAPGLCRMGNYLDRPAEPYNDHEPVDSSAAAMCAQGYLRLGRYLKNDRYTGAGLSITHTICAEPYLGFSPDHEGLLLHSVYHQPNGWDYIPPGKKVPSGEACMWGDYHLMELAVCIKRLAAGQDMPNFYDIRKPNL